MSDPWKDQPGGGRRTVSERSGSLLFEGVPVDVTCVLDATGAFPRYEVILQALGEETILDAVALEELPTILETAGPMFVRTARLRAAQLAARAAAPPGAAATAPTVQVEPRGQ